MTSSQEWKDVQTQKIDRNATQTPFFSTFTFSRVSFYFHSLLVLSIIKRDQSTLERKQRLFQPTNQPTNTFIMIRQATLFTQLTLRQNVGRSSVRTLFSRNPMLYSNNYHQRNSPQLIVAPLMSPMWRSLSSQSNNKDQEQPKQEKDASSGGDGDDTTKEIVLTPGEKVVAATRLSMWFGIFCFASACAYYIGKELIPTKMSPNSVFNSASKVIRDNPQVQRQYGDKLKFYGKDHGGHREGRRNFIEHTQYTSEDDGSKRTRVRFNLEGQFAQAFCFAEVSNEMSSGEFVYILVQDKQTGRVVTVVDNRAAMTAQRLAGGNKETADAMKQLLGGGKQ
jgi:import inner membrane translocase subunit TIM21